MKKFLFKLVAGTLKKQVKSFLRRNPDLKIVAITGSTGKTFTKVAVGKVLEQKFKTQYHYGNYNTEIGLPLSLVNLESPGSVTKIVPWIKVLIESARRFRQPFEYEVVVMEMGAAKMNDIEYFMSFIKPHIGIITSVQPSHVEGFGSVENIATEKLKLGSGSQSVLLNTDDPILKRAKDDFGEKEVYEYGLTQGDYRFEVSGFEITKGFTGKMILRNNEIQTNVHVIAKHSLRSVIAAAAVGELLGLGPDDLRRGIEEVRPFSGRMNPLAGLNGSLIIDDSYNANPISMKAALDVLYGLEGRKIAVLGGMNELGTVEEDGHKEVGQYAADVDLLVTIGEKAKKYTRAAESAGLPSDKIKSFANPYDAGDFVASILKEGDKVLVKGSQGDIFSEEVTAKILKNPEDKKNLVRQSDFWADVKKKAFNL